MCGRSSLSVNEEALEKRFGATFYSEDLERYNPLPSFNIAPTHYHPLLTGEDALHFQYMRWGLVPFWAKDMSIASKMINARVETVQSKPAFRQALEKRRCIVPFDGYYEWMKEGKKRIPYRIVLHDKSIFTIAGMYETWKMPNGELLYSFTLITQPAADSIAHIHDRMPAMLPKDQESMWLEKDMSTEDLLKLIQPLPDDQLAYYPVSDKVNKVSENSPELIEQIDPNDKTGTQLNLFD